MAENFDAPDVRQLGEQDCPAAEFPAAGREDFRVYLDEKVHARIGQHAAQDTSVEVGGVLVGKWGRDADGPFVAVSECIRCDSARSGSAEVTFTHDTWSTINRQMDTRFTDLCIVGWYHSHPDFGIFLSERDAFIQQHFFCGPGQIAYVVDPVGNEEGVFAWREGKPTLCPHYWIGRRIYVESGQTSARDRRPADSNSDRSSPSGATSGPTAGPELLSFSSTLRLLAPYLLVFLVGYLISGGITAWQQRRLIEGTVVHYGIWKGLRPGLDRHLQVVDDELRTLSSEVGALAAEHVKLAGDEAAARKTEWKRVQDRLQITRLFVRGIEETYCLTPDEAAVVAKIIAAKTTGTAEDGAKAGDPMAGDAKAGDVSGGVTPQAKAPPTTDLLSKGEARGNTPQPTKNTNPAKE